MATPGVFEIFGETAKQKNVKIKAAFLQQYGNNRACKSILQGCYHPAVKFLLPEGDPPYSENDPTMVETRLYSMSKRFDMFIEGGRPISSQTKREMLFIELLESIHPLDAKIVLNMVKKQDPIEGVTQEVAHMAFPDLVPAPVEEVAEVLVEEKPKAKTKAKRKPTKKAAAKAK